MKNCLILINDKAGKCKKCSVEKVCGQIGNHNFTSMHLPCPYPIDLNKYDSLAVCGGDGTLQLIMQEIYRTDKTVYYFPCGTLNDKGKAEKYNHTQENPHQVTVGKIDDDLFTYVLAGGAFTEIGYTAQIQEKQKYGVFAYIMRVLKAYKINRIKCKITIENNGETKDFVGDFNLVMFIKSPRCFGFKFNHAFDEKDEGGHLLLIRSPRHNGLLGKVEMFFPFFRVFFLGLKKERDDAIVFKHISNAKVYLNRPTDFCMDGEKHQLCGAKDLSFVKTNCKLKIIDVD